MNRNEFVQALKAGKVSGAYLFEGVEENIKSVTLAALRVPALPAGVRYRTVPGIAGYDADIRRKGVLLRAHSRRSRRKKSAAW